MDSTAYKALRLVLHTHAGCLGGYTADKRARLFRAREMLEECEDKTTQMMQEEDWSPVAVAREQTYARLQRFAPALVLDNYISTYFHIQRSYKKRLSDDRRNEKRRVPASMRKVRRRNA